MGNLCARPAPRPAPQPAPPTAGTILESKCEGTTMKKKIANGTGGSTNSVIPNSPDCGYEAPVVTLDSILTSNGFSDFDQFLTTIPGVYGNNSNPNTFSAKVLSLTNTEKNGVRNTIANKVTTEKLTTLEQLENATIDHIKTLSNKGLNEDTAEFFITMNALSLLVTMSNFMEYISFTDDARIDYNEEITNQALNLAKATPRGSVMDIKTYILTNYTNFVDLDPEILASLPASYSQPFVSTSESAAIDELAAAAAAAAAEAAAEAEAAAAAAAAASGGGDTFQNMNNKSDLIKKELKKFKLYFNIKSDGFRNKKDGFRNKKDGFRNNKVNNFTGYSLECSTLLPKDYAEF